MTLRNFSFWAAVALAMLGTGPAKAADLDPALEDPVQDFSQMPVANVTFGSGWYVRGDFGGAQLYQANPFATGLPSKTSTSSDQTGVTLRQSDKLGYVGGIGGGYAFTSHLRADVVVDYNMPSNSTSFGKPFHCINGFNTAVTTVAEPTYANCTGAYQANLHSYDALVNGYYDIGTWYNVTPYVGAGIGFSFGHYQAASAYTTGTGAAYDISITNPVSGLTRSIDYDRSASHTYYNFAYALMAGFAFPIFSHTSVDIGYRFLDLGTVLGTNLREQQVRAGLRYMIDN